ncbi:outer membrane protein assembly factor BamE [Glacieibacterium megasporae]|uniref:outer membrane protein assembly factor BamE n=1 Tax=Glacieibacterium megasporae TaxID=2835787 RepID=UPI001C1E09A8|nr:outer membrane protein assembly factor BamE [Polymorphobacter megasporae]UAJ09847.1 outer membrane protein assembly factor BamE [Polymorphobacter megasporae]
MRFTFPIAATIAAALLVTSGCSTIKQNQGYIVDEALVTSVQPGVDNKDSVQKTLGRPTFAAQFDAGEWYYISRNTRQIAFLYPKAQSQGIIKISFDPRGNVTKIERRGLEEVVNVRPLREKTPTLGRNTGIFEDIFGGVGAFGSANTPTDSAGGTSTGRDGPK